MSAAVDSGMIAFNARAESKLIEAKIVDTMRQTRVAWLGISQPGRT